MVQAYRASGLSARIEAALRAQSASPLEGQRTRWLQSRHHHDHIGQLITYLSNRRRITPKSPLGQALAYAAHQWPHLERCFHDGQIEWDNNLTENTIRPTKLGHGRCVDKAFDIPSLPPRLPCQRFIETISI